MKLGESEESVIFDTTVDAGRRSAMRKIAVGVGVLASYSVLPESWTKPIIGQIVLPAHAGTSGSSLHDPCQVELRGGDHTTEEIILKITGFITPPVANLPVTITSTAVGGSNQKVETKATTSAEGTFEVQVTIGGGPGITSVNVTTAVKGADGVANCVVHTTAASNSNPNVCSQSSVLGTWRAIGNAPQDNFDRDITLLSGGVSHTQDGNGGYEVGTWTLVGNILTIVDPFVDQAHEITGVNTLTGTLGADCISMTGTIVTTASNGQSANDTFTGNKLSGDV